ncbi:hypothetical protein FOG48_02521 [Hanseniaspora uvarum]|nr:hypothetical protein FOG48_02521 [Hanseniaspora uvarum]
MGRPKKIVSEEIIKQYNLELKIANNNSGYVFKVKSNRSTSCYMCKQRKTKCIKTTNEKSCLNCLKSFIECIQPKLDGQESLNENVDENSKIQYIKFLEGKLSSMEECLDELKGFENTSKDQLNQMTFNMSKQQPFFKKVKKYKKVSQFLKLSNLDYDNVIDKLYKDIKKFEHKEADGISLTSNKPTSVGSPNGVFDLLATRTLPPLFKKSSPALQNDLNRDINENMRLQSMNSNILGSIDFSKCILSKYNLSDFLSYDPAFSFDEVLACQFLEIYFTRLQFKYPILDKNDVFSFHSYYTQLNNQSISSDTNHGNYKNEKASFLLSFLQKFNMQNTLNTWKNSGNPIDYHYYCSRSWIIFAISSCLHKTSGKYKGLPPNRYFSTAIRHLAKCRDQLSSWQKLEILSLSLQYIIRTDRDSIELYVILKDVVNIAINDLKLNDLSDCTMNPDLKNQKIRLFWSVYLMERMICNAVEKPFLILNSAIPKDYPLFDYGNFENGVVINTNIESRGPSEQVHFINQVIKLRILESKFTTELDLMNWRKSSVDVHNVEKMHELRKSELEKVEFYYKNLCEWRSNCKLRQFRDFETETLKLYYYRSVRLLIQPYLELLKPHSKLFRECQAAAGQICQLYKIFHQKTVFGHSTSAVHTVFSAGLTLVYCLWLARNHDDMRRRKLGDRAKHTRPTLTGILIASFDDLRACSVSLYVMAERSRFAVIYRDTFDQLMQCTIGNLIERSGPNSSELIATKFILKKDNSKNFISESSKSNSNMMLNKMNGSKFNAKENAKTLDNVYEGEEDFEDSDDYDEEENKDVNENVLSPNYDKNKTGIPAAVNRKFGLSQEIEHSGFLQNIQVDAEEMQDLKRRRKLLKKTMIPKPLSHMLDAYDSEKNINGYETQPKATNLVKKKNISVYEESDHLKDQIYNERFLSAKTVENDSVVKGNTSSSSFGSPKYYVQKPLQNPSEEEWRDLELKALIKQQAGQKSLEAYLSGIPLAFNTDNILSADTWDVNLNTENNNNLLLEGTKPLKSGGLAASPNNFNVIGDYGEHGVISYPDNLLQNSRRSDSKNTIGGVKYGLQHVIKNNGSPLGNINDNSSVWSNSSVPALPKLQNGPLDQDSLDVGINGKNQSTVQHMIMNISQWTSAGFKAFLNDEIENSEEPST